MFFVECKRIIRTGLVSFYRNGFTSLSAVLVMTVTLFVIGTLLFFSAILESSLGELRNKVDINVYFITTAPEAEVLKIKDSIAALPEVERVEYVSRQAVLEDYKNRHQDEELHIRALEEVGDNPFGATINIKAKDPAQYEGITKFLESDTALGSGKGALIDSINYHRNKIAIDRLSKIIVTSERLGTIVTILLAIISVLISFNTIRLAIYISREEISVMRLVGAVNTFIRGPFVVAGILYGLVAALFTLTLLYPATYYLSTATKNFFIGLDPLEYYFSHFGEFFGIIVGSGVALGAISSYLAVRRYLKV